MHVSSSKINSVIDSFREHWFHGPRACEESSRQMLVKAKVFALRSDQTPTASRPWQCSMDRTRCCYTWTTRISSQTLFLPPSAASGPVFDPAVLDRSDGVGGEHSNEDLYAINTSKSSAARLDRISSLDSSTYPDKQGSVRLTVEARIEVPSGDTGETDEGALEVMISMDWADAQRLLDSLRERLQRGVSTLYNGDGWMPVEFAVEAPVKVLNASGDCSCGSMKVSIVQQVTETDTDGHRDVK